MSPAANQQRRYFLCNGRVVDERELHQHPRAHILGHLVYRDDESRKVTGLAIWTVSVPANSVPLLKPNVKVVIIGDAREICCDQCERRPRWEIGKAAQEVIFERLLKERYPEGWKAVLEGENGREKTT